MSEKSIGQYIGIIVNLRAMEREYREMGPAWSERADILGEAAAACARLDECSPSLPAAIETVREAAALNDYAYNDDFDRAEPVMMTPTAGFLAVLDALSRVYSPDSASPAPDTPDSGDGPPERHRGAGDA